MKIESLKPAVVITRFPYESSWGGEESHTLAIARHLRDKGYEVIFMGSCPVLLEKFAQESFLTKQVWGGRMIVTPFELLKSFLIFPFISWNLKSAFKRIQNEYDVKALYSLSLNEKLFLAPYAISQNIPITWVEHQEIRNWLINSPWKRRYQKYSSKVIIVPISKKNETCLLGELSVKQENIQFIINGVKVDEITSIKRSTQKNLIVAANRFIPKKGIRDFLEALRILKEKDIPFSARILGEGEESEKIFDKANEISSENIHISNFLKKENWYKLLSECDVYVSCAQDSNETFSLNTAEALAAGCKIVVTKCSGIADFLENKKDAFLTEPMNPVKLAESIINALVVSEEMRSIAQNTAKKLFDQNRMLLEYEYLILRKNE